MSVVAVAIYPRLGRVNAVIVLSGIPFSSN